MVAQQALFEGIKLNEIVNVAQVRQYSPFRYPGGKTWLVPRIRKWLSSLSASSMDFFEPFAGGGILSLTVAFEHLANRVTMVERDEEVAAVWETILSTKAEWLAKRILNFDLTPESLRKALDNKTDAVNEIAFKTILKNRTYHGGILANGSGILKHGENGKGIHSRWYPETLSKRIRHISSISDGITFIHDDGLEVIRRYLARRDAVWFIDPPYTVQGKGKRAGKRLYTYSELDHEELFRLMSRVSGAFLMTYDNDENVCNLARKYSFDFEPIAMKGTHHTEMRELLVGRDLSWARPSPR